MLAAEGLVELLPNRGAVVKLMSEQDVIDSFEVIAGLEGQSGELAAQRIVDAELAEIRALNYEMRAAHARRDLPTYYRLNAQIHTQINAAARNAVLTQTWSAVNARLQSLRFRSNFDGAKWQRAVDEHAQMVELLAARDAARPARACCVIAPAAQARRGARADARRPAAGAGEGMSAE